MLRFSQSLAEVMSLENLRVALFNYIVAKQLNEELLIRIEDLDKEKVIEGNDKVILELLTLFSIEHKAVVYQSENLKYHQKLTMQLMGSKKAFSCFCSDEKLEEISAKCKEEGKVISYDGFCETLSDETVLNCNAPFTVRIKKPENTVEFTDLLKGNFSFQPSYVDSFIILKHDKTPTYNFACSVDDMLYDISTVIREEKHIENTAKQIYVRNQLNYTKRIDYIHTSSILNVNSNKENDLNSVRYFIEQGFLPSAIANYLVLLGNKTPSEIFTIEEAIEWFDIEKVSNDTVEFDVEKLKLINKKHIATLDEMRLSKILGFADTDIGKLGKLYLDEASTINEIKAKIDLIFSSKDSLKGFEDDFFDLKECLSSAPFMGDFNELEKYIIENTKLDDKSLSRNLRYLLTGTHTGPDLSAIYSLIKNYMGEIVK
ncbi:glutamyl-tRNA synthetase [Arcobacter nitrofigilis DSM 7299]|uniref:Glutamyl-tRNA synthetase n=1 Tax=Arcobacter nitrofigilis (strain ATCC 33309 / DSM 7299 / CCUG 15893 / LMG 7604 / NCTC 12251 / CI) TaxID=572480 RepID=D5V1E5_ARCNC|nr:glutamate--tRNA ligase [Arcobacter nitrofigilis]ADG93379.1 glutamyl-tRNA synthetase [Arcobacter nitrofigilis DSM 7299]